MGEVIEGAVAPVTPVAFTPGSIVILPPRIHIPALTPGTLEGTIFPPQRMDGGLTLVDVEELVEVGEYRHGGASPAVVRSGRTQRGDSHLFCTVLRCYKQR